MIAATDRRSVRWAWRPARAVLGLAVSGVCLYLSLRGAALEEAWRTLRSVAPLPLGAASVLAIAALFARGFRWSRLLAPAATGAWWPLGWSVAIGFAVNNLLPARVGEVARSVSAARKLRVGVGTAFGSVVVERAWDLAGALAVITLGFAAVGSTEGLDALAREAGRRLGVVISIPGVVASLAVAVAGVGAAVLLLAFRSGTALRLAERAASLLPRRWREGAARGLRGFAAGLAAAARRDVTVVLVVSLCLWLAAYVSVWLALTACSVPASLPTLVLVVTALVIAVSLPPGPGFIGTYEYMAASAITASTGVAWERALAAALVLHLTSYVPNTLAGVTALVREGLPLHAVLRDGARAAQVNEEQVGSSEREMIADPQEGHTVTRRTWRR